MLLASSLLLTWGQSLLDRFAETYIFIIFDTFGHPWYILQAVGGIFASGTNVVVLAMGASATDAAFFCFVIRWCFRLFAACNFSCGKTWTARQREAILCQIGWFFTHCVKGGGIEPMCKNLCCKFVSFWRPFDNIKLTQKSIFKGKIVTILR